MRGIRENELGTPFFHLSEARERNTHGCSAKNCNLHKTSDKHGGRWQNCPRFGARTKRNIYLEKRSSHALKTYLSTRTSPQKKVPAFLGCRYQVLHSQIASKFFLSILLRPLFCRCLVFFSRRIKVSRPRSRTSTLEIRFHLPSKFFHTTWKHPFAQ